MNRISVSILSVVISGQLAVMPLVQAAESETAPATGPESTGRGLPNPAQPSTPSGSTAAPFARGMGRSTAITPGLTPLPRPPQAFTPTAPTSGAPSGNQAMRPGEMMFNFQDADIQAVVKTVSQITGKNFLIDPRVKGKLTIISTQPVSRSAVYQIFLAALKAQGFTTTEGPAGLLKIIPLGDAKQSAEVTSGEPPRRGEQTITHIVTVQHGSATQMVPLLRPLMAPTSQLAVYPPGNALIITDYADNIRNLLRIVDILDQRGNAEITIVPLRYASAVDIAEVMIRLYPNVIQSGGQLAPQVGAEGDRVTIMPDLRTNSLLIRAENLGTVNNLRGLIEKLDVPAKVGGNTRVVYLRNAEATKLAEILRGLLSGEARATQAAASATPGRPAAVGGKAAEASQIQADEATNSLVISASDAVFNNLRAVIEKLDVRRAQVFVEALIVEITTDKASQFGFQWAGGNKAGTGTVGAITNFPAAGTGIAAAATNPSSLASAAGLTVAFLGKKITLPNGTSVRSLGALATALEETSGANILSTPNLLTLDNAEAKIIVGQNVPFLTGSFSQATSTTGAVNPFQTIERKDIGLTLKIKPQISEGGSVKLQIYEENSSVATATGVQASDLITNKRSLDTTIIVDDGNTVVLGGLIEDSVQDTTQAVPFLGNIPILGWLFKSRNQKKTKTNLMVFLRPIIVRGPEDSYGFTANRYEHMHALGKNLPEDASAILEGFKPVVPPPRDKTKDKKSDDTTSDTAPDSADTPATKPDTDKTQP